MGLIIPIKNFVDLPVVRIVVIGFALHSLPAQAFENSNGRFVGGGEGYGDWVEVAENEFSCDGYMAMAECAQALKSEVESASPNDTIYIDDDEEIDLSSLLGEPDENGDIKQPAIRIPGGVTVASGRGKNGSLGALLYSDTEADYHLIEVDEPGVVITGLRLRGPTDQVNPPGCGKQDPQGVYVNYVYPTNPANPSFELHNMEMWQWPHAAVFVDGEFHSRVHHNHIHHNLRYQPNTEDGATSRDPAGCDGYGLGYGVETNYGEALVEANIFDHNRHDIASTGRPGSRYTAGYNVSVEGAISHNFDMHGCNDRKSGSYCNDEGDYAGEYIRIHNNTFLDDSERAVTVRGIPTEGAYIEDNRFRHASWVDAFYQRYATGSVHSEGNVFNFGRYYPTIWFIRYGGKGEWKFRMSSYRSASDFLVGDFDGDGADDLFYSNGSQWYMRRFGREEEMLLASSSVPFSKLRVGNFDGVDQDGKVTDDIFRSNGERWYYSKGGASAWSPLARSTVRLEELRFGDFDNDGRTDVFRTNGARWYFSSGGDEGWAPMVRSSVSLYQLAFGDFDGTGSTDVFRGNGFNWYISKDGQHGWTEWGRSAYKVDDLAFCDFNGDGFTDIFRATGSTWRVTYGENKRTSGWEYLNTSNLDIESLLFGDFNGDGKCDIMARRSI